MDVRITLKFLKTEPSLDVAVCLQPNPNAFEVIDQDYTANNLDETILCLIVSKDNPIALTFDLKVPVRRVVFDHSDMSLETTAQCLTLHLPPLSGNHDRVADMHMNVTFSGVDLRMEVARPEQRAGLYLEGRFPQAARTAAMTVEFALLEAIQVLGLDQEIGHGLCGPILLMGFDTNNPCGHTDWPPHVHLHMAKPAYGAPIGHYYFDDDLRISHNLLYLRKIKTPIIRFEKGESCVHYAPDGSILFDLMITKTGGLCLISSSQKSAFIEPIASGFDHGALVKIGDTVKRIHAKIDNDACEVNVQYDDTAITFAFERDTGIYLGEPRQSVNLQAEKDSLLHLPPKP